MNPNFDDGMKMDARGQVDTHEACNFIKKKNSGTSVFLFILLIF